MHRWINKENVVYMHNRILSIKNNKILSLAKKWIEFEVIVLNEINQTHRQLSHVVSYMLNLDF
jgi:hypothetical protein